MRELRMRELRLWVAAPKTQEILRFLQGCGCAMFEFRTTRANDAFSLYGIRCDAGLEPRRHQVEGGAEKFSSCRGAAAARETVTQSPKLMTESLQGPLLPSLGV